MLKQSIGMTENNAKQIAEMYLSRYNPTYWMAAASSFRSNL